MATISKRDLSQFLSAVDVTFVGKVDNEFRIECDIPSAGNALDHASLEMLLSELKTRGLVGQDTKTIWFGRNNWEPKSPGKFKLWASAPNVNRKPEVQPSALHLVSCNCSVADVCPQGKTGMVEKCSIWMTE
jgi:hypothetical protein